VRAVKGHKTYSATFEQAADADRFLRAFGNLD